MQVLSDGARDLWCELRETRVASADTAAYDPAWYELLRAGLIDWRNIQTSEVHLVDCVTLPKDVPEGGGVQWRSCRTCGWFMQAIWNKHEQCVSVSRCLCKLFLQQKLTTIQKGVMG